MNGTSTRGRIVLPMTALLASIVLGACCPATSAPGTGVQAPPRAAARRPAVRSVPRRSSPPPRPMAGLAQAVDRVLQALPAPAKGRRKMTRAQVSAVLRALVWDVGCLDGSVLDWKRGLVAAAGTARVTVSNALCTQSSRAPKVSISIALTVDARHVRDVDGDGLAEMFLTALESAGGTAGWHVLYCLDPRPGGGPLLRRLRLRCPCSAPYRPRSSPKFEISEVTDRGLVVTCCCNRVADSEAACTLRNYVEYDYDQGVLTHPITVSPPDHGDD